jgi:hypothetical protein
MSTYVNKLLVLAECNVNGIKPGLNLDQAPIFLNILGNQKFYKARKKPYSKLHQRIYQTREFQKTKKTRIKSSLQNQDQDNNGATRTGAHIFRTNSFIRCI